MVKKGSIICVLHDNVQDIGFGPVLFMNFNDIGMLKQGCNSCLLNRLLKCFLVVDGL